ncbi:hypothetical protein STENOSP10_25590 [Stenotrophomonas sepilia]|uniref:Fimbrial-type adhesion domain-containing protein n=1 Tax=Stenotrophomonas sepilia TaxID=2860290 RepID=A0ABQ6QDR8_9GAMM|nr:hypothetical protein STENOSP10_25590 [Stenotrophomonas sepilia]
MNKLAIALTAALSLGAAASANAATADITFAGEILETTCSITVGGSGTAVALNRIAVANMGGPAANTPFTLTAGNTTTGCPAGTLKMRFSGAEIDTDGTLKNATEATDAKNVALRLYHGTTELDLNTAEISAVVAGGIATYNMNARYVQVGSNAVEHGAFSTGVKVDVFY